MAICEWSDISVNCVVMLDVGDIFTSVLANKDRQVTIFVFLDHRHLLK